MSSKRSTRCPILCGACCYKYWKNVHEIIEDLKIDLTAEDCPHLGKSGCKLSRKERPSSCLEYFCPAAEGVMNKSITLEEGIDLASSDKQDCTNAWPKRIFDKYNRKLALDRLNKS